MVPAWFLHSHTWSIHDRHLVKDHFHNVGNNIKAFDISDIYNVERVRIDFTSRRSRLGCKVRFLQGNLIDFLTSIFIVERRGGVC